MSTIVQLACLKLYFIGHFHDNICSGMEVAARWQLYENIALNSFAVLLGNFKTCGLTPIFRAKVFL